MRKHIIKHLKIEFKSKNDFYSLAKFITVNLSIYSLKILVYKVLNLVEKYPEEVRNIKIT